MSKAPQAKKTGFSSVEGEPRRKTAGTQTIFWWIVWIAITIGSFFIASAIWTPIIAKHFGSVREARTSALWVAAVFGTWMIFLIPLIILMYSKVDKAYEDARIRRENNAKRFRSIFVEPSKRALPASVAGKMLEWPFTIEGGHLANVQLQNGKRVENVFISERKEVLGVYNESDFNFEGKDITDVELVDLKKAPAFLTNLWLRLDGVSPQE